MKMLPVAGAASGAFHRRRVLKMLALAAFLLLSGGAGTLPAASEMQQEDTDTSAGKAVESDQSTTEGMDSVSGLVDDQPVTREVRRAIRQRELAVESRERELVRREKALEALKKDIEGKFADLERKRADLQALTTEVDDARDTDLAAAVKIYNAMDAAATAKFFNQMDAEKVIPILRKMSAVKTGEILAAMRADAEQAERLDGTEAGQPSEREKRLENLKKIAERIADPSQTLPVSPP